MVKYAAEKQKVILKKIAQRYNLELILLFGSQIGDKKYLNKESDFDIAYLSGRSLDLTDEAKLIVEIAPIFRSENIDLVNLRKAPPLLFYAITKNCRVIYEKKPPAFAYLRAYAFKKYIETKPLYEDNIKKIQKELATA